MSSPTLTFRLSSGIRWKVCLFGGLLPVESQPETGSLSLPSWNLLRYEANSFNFSFAQNVLL
jgi:hypothetical protein